MRHFKTRKEANAFKKSKPWDSTLRVFKKLKGHKNRTTKPFVVGTYFEWLNLY